MAAGTLYTDVDAHCCRWVENLISAGPLPAGQVLCADVRALRAADLAPFRKIHFFAGIGAWEEGLRLAGWGGREVWTASLPCQPFSNAGLKRAGGDDRHLWPAFRDLVAARMPETLFGEQVCSPEGREWARGVVASLRGLGYDAAWFDLPCSAVGLPHARPRIWWAATLIPAPDEPAGGHGEGAARGPGAGALGPGTRAPLAPVGAGGGGAEGEAPVGGREDGRDRGDAGGRAAGPGGVAHPHLVDERWLPGPVGRGEGAPVQAAAAPGGGGLDGGREALPAGRTPVGGPDRGVPGGVPGLHPRFAGGDVLVFADGAARLVEPGTGVLAPRSPGCVGAVRALGNSLSPLLAAEFVGAFMRARGVI